MPQLSLAVIAAGACAVLAALAVPPARAVEVGQAAPPIEADATTGRFRLADFRGVKNVLLAFYYKDFTGG
jgi:hypothetical protein